MKNRLLLSASVLLPVFLLAACVPSVNPLYTPETTVFRPELLGVWKEKPESEDSWNFSKSDTNTYTVVIQDKDSTATFSGHLVNLGGSLFLDLFPTEDIFEKAKASGMYRVAFIPGHLFARVKIGKKLEVQMLNFDGLKELLAGEPKALAHAAPEQDRIVITASTDELQKFCKKYADSRTIWGDPGVFEKIQL